METLSDFFINPFHQTHRKYEALRALCVENKCAREVANKFGYSVYTVNAFKKDFSQLFKQKCLAPELFFSIRLSGRPIDNKKVEAKNKIIQMAQISYSNMYKSFKKMGISQKKENVDIFLAHNRQSQKKK